MEPRFEDAVPQAEKEIPLQPEAGESDVALSVERESQEEMMLLDAQKEKLLQKGQELGLDQSSAQQVLEEHGYTEKQNVLKTKMRKLAEAISLSLALGAPMMAQAQNTEVEKVESGVEAVQVSTEDVQKETVFSPEEVGVEGIVNTPELEPMIPEEAPEEVVPPLEEGEKIEGAPEETTEEQKQEGGELKEPQKEKEKQEIKNEAANKRFLLAQELITIVLTEGATSPKAMEKLLALAGKAVKEEKEAMADMVATRMVPYYDSIKKIVEAAKGSKFSESKPLEGFDRLSHFLKGVAGVALDSSQLGNVGRLVSKLNKLGGTLDTAENTARYLSILEQIKENPNDLEGVLKLLEKAEGGTMVQKTKQGVEDSARNAYDKITRESGKKEQNIAKDTETQPYAH